MLKGYRRIQRIWMCCDKMPPESKARLCALYAARRKSKLLTSEVPIAEALFSKGFPRLRKLLHQLPEVTGRRGKVLPVLVPQHAARGSEAAPEPTATVDCGTHVRLHVEKISLAKLGTALRNLRRASNMPQHARICRGMSQYVTKYQRVSHILACVSRQSRGHSASHLIR